MRSAPSPLGQVRAERRATSSSARRCRGLRLGVRASACRSSQPTRSALVVGGRECVSKDLDAAARRRRRGGTSTLALEPGATVRRPRACDDSASVDVDSISAFVARAETTPRASDPVGGVVAIATRIASSVGRLDRAPIDSASAFARPHAREPRPSPCRRRAPVAGREGAAIACAPDAGPALQVSRVSTVKTTSQLGAEPVDQAPRSLSSSRPVSRRLIA